MNWRNWLPSPQQISNAAQLRPGAYGQNTMQQAIGMIVLLALAAGLVPFAVHWFVASQAGTVLPLALAVRSSADAQELTASLGSGMPWATIPAALHELYQTLAGMEQPLAGWLAGALSALGEWVNWPIRWLSIWIVYGAGVMVANKALGGNITLQRFYAATSFAAAPLLLLALSPIPCLGSVATLGGVGWSLAVYARANRDVTGLEWPRAIGAVLLPGLVAGLAALVVGGLLLGMSTLFFL
ncbi:MAG: hypothetical protein KF753_22055 [Caldilineaceae bacterium]|nr:hypothetical protein [Caldilineaceae bacterium]